VNLKNARCNNKNLCRSFYNGSILCNVTTRRTYVLHSHTNLVHRVKSHPEQSRDSSIPSTFFVVETKLVCLNISSHCLQQKSFTILSFVYRLFSTILSEEGNNGVFPADELSTAKSDPITMCQVHTHHILKIYLPKIHFKSFPVFRVVFAQEVSQTKFLLTSPVSFNSPNCS
jgi:hypothetical protein